MTNLTEQEAECLIHDVVTWTDDKLNSFPRITYQYVTRGDVAVFPDGTRGVFLNPTRRYNNPNVILSARERFSETFPNGRYARTSIEEARYRFGRDVIFRMAEHDLDELRLGDMGCGCA